MKSIQTQIKLLKDALEYKRRILNELLDLTSDQSEAIRNEQDYLERFDKLSDEKKPSRHADCVG